MRVPGDASNTSEPTGWCIFLALGTNTSHRCSRSLSQTDWVASRTTNRSNRHSEHHSELHWQNFRASRDRIMVVTTVLVLMAVGRTKPLGRAQRPWEGHGQCLTDTSNTSRHSRSEPKIRQSEWDRMLVPPPSHQVGSLSWPLEQ